jgi:nicotinate-nucleotide adenylyltransferase
MMRIVMHHVALYGGSFNPPHVAHQMACLYVLSVTDVDQVWMMPSFHHPFAKQLVDFDRRVELCQAAARVFGERVQVSRIEQELDEGRTLRVVQALQARHPDHRFSLVIGMDALAERTKWYRFAELEKLVTLIVLGRQGVEPISGYTVLPALPGVSSTEVRRRLARNEDVRWLVPARVRELIAQHGLYAEEEEP